MYQQQNTNFTSMEINLESLNGDGQRDIDEVSDHITQSTSNHGKAVKNEKTYETKPAPAGGRRSKKKPVSILENDEDDEPLVDTTAALQLHSKKTERMQKRLEKKSKKKPAPKPQSFLDLPSELILEILTYLRPSDLFRLQRLNKPM